MAGHRTVIGLAVVLSLVVAAPIGLALTDAVDGPIGTAVAREDAGEEGEAGEGGIEGMIEEWVEDQGLIGATLVLVLGGVILVMFVEKLISYLSRAAIGLGVSVFSLAVLFTGFEFDDTILALVFASGGLEDAALGTALGTALAIVGITLAVAAVARPFPVDVPRDYLALLVVSPLILVPLVLLGNLSTSHGVVLLALFSRFSATSSTGNTDATRRCSRHGRRRSNRN